MPKGIKGFQKGHHPKTEFKKGGKHPNWKGKENEVTIRLGLKLTN